MNLGILLLAWSCLATLAAAAEHARSTADPPWRHPRHRDEWARYLARLPASRTPEAAAQLQPLLDNHNFTLSLRQVRRSAAYVGPNSRLRRVLAALMQRDGPTPNISIGAIGGSVGWGTSASDIGRTDWFSQLSHWLWAAFPHANIKTRNGCAPASTSAFAGMCLQSLVDVEEVDLVLVEYVTTDYLADGVWNNRHAKTFERLLRKLANLPRRPAVVLLQHPPRGQAFAADQYWKRQFHQTNEDMYGTLGMYYEMPAVSIRDAVWVDAEYGRAAGMGWSRFMAKDRIHPTDPGMRFLSDIVIWLLLQSAVDVLDWPPTSIELADAQFEALPPPMYPNNFEEANLLCLHGEQLREVVVEAGSSGWALVNEGTPDRPKVGYVSTVAGSQLLLRLDTSTPFGRQLPQGHLYGAEDAAAVQISYLRSYIGMGNATVRCVSGCSCEDSVLVGHHSLPTSQPVVKAVKVMPPSLRCDLTVTLDAAAVLSADDAGGTAAPLKFKVLAVMLTDFMAAFGTLNSEHADGGFRANLPESWARVQAKMMRGVRRGAGAGAGNRLRAPP